MAHDITATDGLILARKPAWHGLGTVVEHAPSATEAMKIAGLEWSVDQWPLVARRGQAEQKVASHVVNIRADTQSQLGVVGCDFRPVQNDQLATFVDTLAEQGQVRIESAGSIRGGKRVWFLVRGESIWVNPNDEVRPYLLVANGHDGTLALTCQPTSIRVVCRNTLDASLRRDAAHAIRFRHEGDITSKLDEAKKTIQNFALARRTMADTYATLNAKAMAREDLQRFWIDVYSATIEPIPAYPNTTAEKNCVKQAQETLARWAENFDRDQARTQGDANAWLGLNAATEWFDHQRATRAKDETKRAEARVFNSLWGSAAIAKRKALSLAMGR